MKRKFIQVILFAFILFIVGCSQSPSNQNTKLTLTSPISKDLSGLLVIQHTYYTNYFDTALKSEIMGKYIQTIEHSLVTVGNNSINRKGVASFTQDPLIPSDLEITTNSFYSKYNSLHKNDGLRVDKGHVNPYTAFDFDLSAAEESMYLENTCPQYSFFNEHQWLAVEQHVIKQVSLVYDKDSKQYKPNQDSITVYTGVLIGKNQINDGDYSIYIPDYYWKVITYKKDGNLVYEAWLGKNSADNTDTNPYDIKIDLDKLKKQIKSYYPNLDLEF